MKLQDIHLLEKKISNTANYSKSVKAIKAIAPHMKAGGWDVNGDTIAPILNVHPEYAEQIIDWGTGKGKLGQAHLGAATGNDPSERILVAIFKAATQGGGLGLERIAKYTGLSEDEVERIVGENWQHLATHTKELTGVMLSPKMFGRVQKAKATYDKAKGSLADQIRTVMNEITNNLSAEFLGKIPAHEIADKLGVARTSVDKELSNNPKLRDLEPYRVLGKQVGTTDKHREDLHIRDKYK